MKFMNPQEIRLGNYVSCKEEKICQLKLSKSTDKEGYWTYMRPLIEPFRNEILALCEAFGNSGIDNPHFFRLK